MAREVQRVGLVGCVKSKLGQPAPARELYISPLFQGRRRYVEQSCDRWFVLSAKHGLVDPDTLLEPYDETLESASRSQRQQWSEAVIRDLALELGAFRGITFEMHAGNEYRAFGLAAGLERLGGEVTVPTEGLGLGQQLAFYRVRH